MDSCRVAFDYFACPIAIRSNLPVNRRRQMAKESGRSCCGGESQISMTGKWKSQSRWTTRHEQVFLFLPLSLSPFLCNSIRTIPSHLCYHRSHPSSPCILPSSDLAPPTLPQSLFPSPIIFHFHTPPIVLTLPADLRNIRRILSIHN